jgi:cyclophilin family peptidyl-prolyl cis-trans isomerase
MAAMNCRQCVTSLFLSVLLFSSGLGAPVIDPISNVSIPAGKSLIVPVTATSPTGQPLTYTVASSTNGIAVVMHTNNPFWQLSVAQVADTNAPGAYQTPYRGGMATVTNVGSLTFMLFPEYAPHTVNVFQGLTTSGFFNSNTIFHRVVTNFVIQGGDPLTNGTGRLVFTYDDEFNPQAMFSGNGQLALANSGKDTAGSQFFVTVGAKRWLDFGYPIFGQLVRGFDVLTNINFTAVDTNSRPLADEIIQMASYVPDTADTVLTLTATNVPGVAGTITVIADDGVGGRATNVFAAKLITDTNSYKQPFIYPNTVTNLVAPVNTTLTNFVNALELDSDKLYWFPSPFTEADHTNTTTLSGNPLTNVLHTLTYNVTNADGRVQLFLVPATNYAGPVSWVFDVSYDSQWSLYQEYGLPLPYYDQQVYTFVFGDTPISGQTNAVTALASVPLSNVLLATFTNGVPGSSSTSFAASINWGDNSTNSGVVTANAAGEKAVLGSHTYAYPGTYPVYVQVQSAIGASATILSFVTVTNQAAAASNLLTVQVTGQGMVSPDYNNASLVVGGSYSISAIPADLWVLASWTDGNGFVLGIGTNLAFTMYPGLSLTANFALATPPSLTIASPSAGQVITNLYSALATVTGTVANNATITSVWYQVNSDGWQEAAGTTSWTASFIPSYGVTNVFRAYAVNNYGYVSTTNTVSVVYLAGDVLTVNTNGLGSITPALSGQLLPLGTNYVLSATPASGFTFANWTGSLSSTNAVLSFTMATNMSLTANFLNKTKPVIAITNLVTGQRVSNSVFTVRGTARDNWLVGGVQYQLNSMGWTSASGTTNWSATLSLLPGTNVFQAYAVDGSGTRSLTNTVNLQFVVTNLLLVSATGKGTLSPNYSNSWLEIGRSYSMKATAGSGFVFTNWVLSTNWTGSATTNNATVSFTMQSNLTLQVNFADVTKPTITITSPTAGQKMTNALAIVKGTATDNWGIGSVLYQLNGGAWALATSTNGWTNWTAFLPLTAGTNVIQASAVDLGGNASATKSVSVVSSNTFNLRLGFGSAQPMASNGLQLSLEVSRGLSGRVEVTTNLRDWTTLTSFVGTNATIQFRDSSATNYNWRFYRAVVP